MSSPRSSGDEDDDTKYNDTMDDGDKPDVRALDQAPAGPSSSPPAARSKQTDLEAMNDSENDEDEDEEDEDDEEDEEDEDEEEAQSRKRAKKRKTNRNRNRFIEDEAEVDDEDEDLDEEDEDYVRETEEFIDQDAALEADGALDPRRVERDHQRLDRRRREYDDLDAERIAAELRERHMNQQARAYSGDDENLPQSMLVPSVEDPKLWQIRAKPGREKQLIFSIMRKSLDLEYTEKPLEIYSAFQRDSLPGLIYVEARSRSAVEAAVQGLVGVYVSRGINLVPIDEMASLLKLTKKRVEITPGSFVRIRRGKYQGDLAQVLDITENGEEVGLKFVPRIDLTPNAEAANANGGKRKKGTMTGSMAGRPPAKFFSSEEVAKSYGARAIVKRGDQFVFQGDTYVSGFIEKDLKVTSIDTEGVMPTMDELEVFSGSSGSGAGSTAEDFTKMQEQARQTAIAVLQPGDVVEVTYDQNKGAVGTVVTISEGIVTIRRTSGENAGAELTVRGEFVKKLFRQGEHVKVVSGKNLDETGLVLKVEGDVVTLMSDLSKEEITAFAKDLRVASEVGSGLNAVGQHELHDLISFGSEFGVIYRTERSLFHVLTLSGKTYQVKPDQARSVDGARDKSAYDMNGQAIHKGETVVEAGGENRSGVVIAIRGLFVFLYSRDISSQNTSAHEGVFVVNPRTLISAASKTARVQTDLTKLNPDISQHVPTGSGVALQGRKFRDPLQDMPVVIVKGINKSRVGLIKDVNGEICRVELQSTNQTVTVNKSALKRKDPRTGATSELPSSAAPMSGVPYRRPASEGPMGPPGTVNPYAGLSGATPNPYAGDGGRTPAFAAGRTPNPYGGATPSGGAWGFGGATPAPGGAGGRTPAYGIVQGGRTPAMGIQGGRTPAPVAGGRTPYGGGIDGGRTPAYGAGAAAGGRTPAYGGVMAGGRTPAYSGGYGGEQTSYGGSGGQGPTSAATPYGAGGSAYQDGPSKSGWSAPSNQSYGNAWDSAPTPGAGLQSAPTPGMYGSAPTPGPTPGAPYSAPTPHGDPYSAPTPGAGPYSAPTPAAGSWNN